MRIPKYIKIKRSRWKIVVDERQLNTKKYNGLCYPTDRLILIDSKLSKKNMEETMIHELLHASFPSNICSFNKEEEIVTKLATVLTPVLSRLLRVQKRYKTSNKKNHTYTRHR